MDNTASGLPGSDVANIEEFYGVTGKISNSENEINQKLDALARTLARILEDDDKRTRVYAKVMELFSGESNALWIHLNTSDIALSDAVLQATNAFSSREDLDDFVLRAGQALGGPIHLYWAFAETFDGHIAPLVTFTPLGVDVDTQEDYIAYNGSGIASIVNEDVARQRPVVVITLNERADFNGNVVGTFSGGSSIVDLSKSSQVLSRVSGYWEIIDRWYLYQDLDGWPHGYGDTWVRIMNPTYPSGDGLVHHFVGEKGPGKFHGADHFLFRWYRESGNDYGYHILVDWYDYDGGSDTYEQTTSFTDPNTGITTTYKSTYRTNDDPMGRQIVNWSDLINDNNNTGGDLYDTGLIKWYHKQCNTNPCQ